jgi:hypothetical protein
VVALSFSSRDVLSFFRTEDSTKHGEKGSEHY